MIEQQLNNTRQNIQRLCNKHQRELLDVTLLAVSKHHAIHKITAAYHSGQRHFGENYLNEALDKQKQLKDLAITWHYIGSIQSNKTKKMAEHFDWVHTVDSLKVATRLSNQRPSFLPALNICLQINIDSEDSKSGLLPDNDKLLALATAIQELPNICLRGLMCIPAVKTNHAEAVASFSRMQALQTHLNNHGLNLDTLSMGMSNDLDEAIQCGATIVRVGTAIFGQRK